MKTGELCIKVLAVVLTVGAVTVAYGRELLLSAFVENKNVESRILVKEVIEDASAIAEIEKTVMGKQKMSVLRGEYGDMPFLVKGIKYNCREEGDYLCFYNSNQKMLFSISANICVYFSYDCEIGEPKLEEKTCTEKAKRGVISAFFRVGTPVVTECKKISESEKIYTFTVKTNMTKDADIKISIRRDTGSVIFFDALSTEDAVLRSAPYVIVH